MTPLGSDSPSGEHVTAGEFGRWRNDFQAFQDRLERRLAEGFKGLNDRLDDLNGRGRSNSEKIVDLDARLAAIDARVVKLEPLPDKLTDLHVRGCGLFETHRQELTELMREASGSAAWPSKKRIAISGALVGSGALIWPAIVEMARAVHVLVGWLGSVSLR